MSNLYEQQASEICGQLWHVRIPVFDLHQRNLSCRSEDGGRSGKILFASRGWNIVSINFVFQRPWERQRLATGEVSLLEYLGVSLGTKLGALGTQGSRPKRTSLYSLTNSLPHWRWIGAALYIFPSITILNRALNTWARREFGWDNSPS